MGEGDRRQVKINGGEAVEDFFNKQLGGGGGGGCRNFKKSVDICNE